MEEYKAFLTRVKLSKKIGFTEFEIPKNIDKLFNINSFIEIIKSFNLEVFFGGGAEENSCSYIILSFGEYPDSIVEDYAETVPEAIRLLKREPKLDFEDWDSYNQRRKDAQVIILKNVSLLLTELQKISIFNGGVFTMPSSRPLIQEVFKEIGTNLNFFEGQTIKQIECKSFSESCENARKKMQFQEHNQKGKNCIVIDDILGWGGSLLHVNRNIGNKPNLFIFFAHDKKNR